MLKEVILQSAFLQLWLVFVALTRAVVQYLSIITAETPCYLDNAAIWEALSL